MSNSTFQLTNIFKLLFLTFMFSTSLSATYWIKTATTAETSKDNNNYQNNQDISTTLSIAGASRLRVKITGTTERRYDFLYFSTTNTGDYKRLDNNINEDFTVNASSVNLRFISDYSIVKSGVKIEIFEIIVPANAVDDTYTMDINTVLNENALDNDEGTGISVISTTLPVNGTLTGNTDGSFVYTPNPDFLGTDLFTYTIEGRAGNTSTATVTITVTPPYHESYDGREFELRRQASIFGNVTMVGNTVICYRGSSGTDSCQNTTSSNGNTFLSKTPESYSTLSLPVKAEVKYARIYWQGRNTTRNDWTEADKNSAKVLQMRQEDDTFVVINADILDVSDDGYNTYAASADVTDYIQTHGEGKYYINPDEFYTITGKPDGLGAYGAWVLVVVYEDTDDTTARNITIFDGYEIIDGSNSVEISVSGFLTPKNGPVESKTYVFVGEGDKYITGDDLLMKGKLFNNSNFVSIAPNSDNAFDSRIDVTGVRNPNLVNNNGIDIQVHDTGTTSTTPIITNDEVGATFRFTTGGDVYYPSLLVFVTELYLPKLCYDYSIKQDGRYLDVDRTLYPVAHLDSRISSSDLDITVYIKNMEADIAAEGIAIRSDVNETVFDQTGNIYTSNTNGSALINRGAPTTTNPLCDYNKDGNNLTTNNGCTDGHNFRKGNGILGDGDYIYTKFSLLPSNISGFTGVDEPLGLSIKYYIMADGNKVEYPDYALGSDNVPLCEPTASYTPQWGQFNVVQSGQSGAPMNNIYTQVSRNIFNTAVVFDSSVGTGNNEAPTSNINTTVLVEIIDISSFGDINASCANPDASLSELIFVPINFDSTNYQIDITAQANDYYNFAVKNAAFRIWYFNDANGTLIQGWTAATSNSNKTLASIANLYDSNVHTQCLTECSTSTSTTCFSCIKTNYAQPLCSRDNFSVRPESYDVRIYDINQSLPAYDLDSDPGNIKNTTKNDISTILNYNPLSSAATTRMNLATGYDYRFDITATGHDGVVKVPGYTRSFEPESDHNVTLTWDPQLVVTNCDDNISRDLSFYIANGIVANEEKLQDQVGEYSLNIIDKTWTAVDWKDTTHHDTSATGGFLAGDDCILNSSTTISEISPLKHGCTITTDHGSDGSGRFYQNHDIEFHPYKFVMSSIMPSVGINNQVLSINATPSFVYMANMFQNNYQDQNMSFHLNGTIQAVSYDNANLSNYVGGCYAKAIDLIVTKSNTTLTDIDGNSILYQANFHNLDENGTIITAHTIDINETSPTSSIAVSTGANYFTEPLKGAMVTRLNFNYDRNTSVAANPKSITYAKYETNCTTPSDCTFYADLKTDKKSEGNLTIDGHLGVNGTVVHYYGRTNAPRQRFVGQTGKDFIYYEVYCNGAGCDIKLLQDGSTSKFSDDPRWFINTQHTNGFGVAEQGATISQKNANNVEGSKPTGLNSPDSTNLVYSGTSYPYKATMENNASSWLIYNKYNATAETNEFEVEFDSGASDWAGKDGTSTNTNRTGATKTNRRSMW